MVPKPTLWGPYASEEEARQCLGAFATRVVGPGAGVIFCDGMGATYLTRPFYDENGSGLVLVATASAPGHVRPPPSSFGSGVWERVETFLHDTFTRIGEAEIARADAQRAMGEAELRLIREGWTGLHAFVEQHKTVFDGAATVGDVFGILAGGVAVVAFVLGGITLLPLALAGTAAIASVALLARDGQLFWAELHGDEMRQKQIENSPVYRTIELVGTLLVLPDLIASGPRALASISKTATEVGETAEGIEHSEAVLNATREELTAYKDAHATKLDRPNIMTKVQRRQARVNRLVREFKAAQGRLRRAQFEFYSLRSIELPAYLASTYAGAMATISPPYLANPAHWHMGAGPTHQPRGCTPEHPLGYRDGDNLLNPMHLLIPPRPSDSGIRVGHGLNFQIAVGRNSAAVQR